MDFYSPEEDTSVVITLILTESLVSELRHLRKEDETLNFSDLSFLEHSSAAGLWKLLVDNNLSITPVHPGIEDLELMRYYTVLLPLAPRYKS